VLLAARETLAATPPFSDWPPELIDRLAAAAEPQALGDGDRLFDAGDNADALFVVVAGALHEVVSGAPDVLIAEVGPRQLAGEVQILTGGRRVTAVRASGPTQLLRIAKHVVDAVTATDGPADEGLSRTIRHRLRRDRFAVIVARLFGTLTPQQLEDIIAAGTWVTLPQGGVLMRQGDPSDGFGILVDGLLGVSVQTDGETALMSRMYSGEVVGEIALLTDDRRVATVFAVRESTLVRFSKETFFELAHRYPQFLLRIARLNIERLRRTQGALRDEPATATVGLIPLSTAVPIAELARELTVELSDYCRVLRVDAQAADQFLGVAGAAQSAGDSPFAEKFGAWLSSLHGQHRIVLLEGDASDSNWTRRCIRHSDQLVMVALADGNPLPGPLEALMEPARDAGVPQRLVLLHPRDTRHPINTSRWLAPRRRLEMHHHLRRGERSDMRRLARFLDGSAVCLALGGGGARAFAQIGALRAFHQAGVAIDMIAGTSMGAVMGAEYALGVPPNAMPDVNRDMFQKSGLLRDLTLPLLSFTTGKPYVAKLQKVFGDLHSEDLWIPFICLSSNISRAQMVMHREGLLWRNLRATSSVQGLFPPVIIDGELHVDGALFSNLPADVLKSLGAGRVIAVDVTPPVDLVKNSEYGDNVSGWWILWHRLFRRRGSFHVTDIGTVLQRAAEAASMANQKHVIEKAADFYLRMPVDHIGLLDFKALDELVKIGFDNAMKALPEWRASRRWVES
jgi:predicted acylesterase/phospholipase RssA/CRP-like cAMP-binding protein